MVKVTLNGTVLAEAANPPVVEGNYYFPPDTVNKSAFTDSSTRYVHQSGIALLLDVLLLCVKS